MRRFYPMLTLLNMRFYAGVYSPGKEEVKLTNQEWLKSLKEGDQVAYDNSRLGTKRYVITTVKKITPKGMIRTDDGYLFNSDGYYRSSDFWEAGLHLEPVTEEILDSIKRKKLIQEFETIKFNQLTNDQLEKILKIVSE